MIKYDIFQKKAIDYAKEGYSTMVCAPTGAGKTLIAEAVIKECLVNGQGAIYTAPIKALSNQKYRDFCKIFNKEKVGIVTGDVSINPGAPLNIMTTEIFRNYLLQNSHKLKNKSWVIFDEIHYLDDIERGTVWEESLIMLPQHMNFLALSATVPNAGEIIEWIKTRHEKQVRLVWEEKRPVPLHFYFHCQNKIIPDFKELQKILPEKIHGRAKPNKVVDLIEHLKIENRLPCVYFSFSRRRCQNLAWEILRFNFLNKEEGNKIIGLYDNLLEKFDLSKDWTAQHILPLIKRGIAYHHAGMLPTLKEVIERLFTSGLLKAIFTTETFALGINMPARTVCFDNLVKFYGRFTRFLKTRDFYQMAGRAGRRGIDKEGFVYIRVNPYEIGEANIKNIILSPLEPVFSQFNASYATILNLYSHLNEKLLDIYPLTLHYFQQTKKGRQQGRFLLEAKLRLLKHLGYIHEERIMPKGIFSSNLFGYELILGELFADGYLDKLSYIELNILIASLVSEPKRGRRFGNLTRDTRRIQTKLWKLISNIHREERRHRIWPRTKKAFFHLSRTMEVWSRGASFNEALRACSIDEGELIRNIRMCIQILREMTHARTSTILKNTASKALNAIKRDIVDAEKQLSL